MYKYDEYNQNIVKYNNKEEYDELLKYLYSNGWKPVTGGNIQFDLENNNYIYFSNDSHGKTYCSTNSVQKDHILHKIEDIIDIKFILKNKLKTLEDKLRTLFNNHTTCLVADTKKEKLKLLKLLNKLDYKTHSGNFYDEKLQRWSDEEKFIIPGVGSYGDKIRKNNALNNYNLVNFKNILKEIDLEELKQLYE